MTEFKADLHCHTTMSDGSATPEEIIQIAKNEGLSGLSITDHDSVDAYSIVLDLAKKNGIEMITGVEFSAIQGDVTVHVLGYAFSHENPIIQAFCQKHHQRRAKRNRAILEKLEQHGMPVSEEEILDNSQGPKKTIGRPHIALAMIKKGYIKSIYDAFNKFLGEGKKCYASGESFTVEETIDIIHQANGLAIIAHPHLLRNRPILDQLLAMPFDGLEGYYANFTPEKNKRWLRFAEKKGWLVTGGSDFHGSVKPQIKLGASTVSKEIFDVLQGHYRLNTNA